jgi:hypothetical protein
VNISKRSVILCCGFVKIKKEGYFLDFLYTSTNQNKPKLRRRIPRPAKKIPIELSVLATSTGIFSPPK